MKTYKLLKDYNVVVGNSIKTIPAGSIVTKSKSNNYTFPLKNSSYFLTIEQEVVEYNPEYFQEIVPFKVGDWVIANGTNHTEDNRHFLKQPFKIKEINGVHISVDHDSNTIMTGDGTDTVSIRLATKEEIETHLIAEAKKRGFVDEVVFASMDILTYLWKKSGNISYSYIPELDELTMYSARLADPESENPYKPSPRGIYKRGTWAKVIAKKQSYTVGDYEVKVLDNDYFKVGCETFRTKDLRNIMCTLKDSTNFKSITFADVTLSLTDIIKLHDYIMNYKEKL